MGNLNDMIVEYVDLALPSGTKWANDYLRDNDGNILYIPYIEAAKMNIPTAEQFKELISNCLIIQDAALEENSGCRFLGTNGKFVHYHKDCFMEAGKKLNAVFPETWLKDDIEGCSEKKVAHFFEKPYVSQEFMGLGYPIILVDKNDALNIIED